MPQDNQARNSDQVSQNTTERPKGFNVNPKTNALFVVASEKVWLKQDGESDIAYDAFETFLKMKSEGVGYTMVDVASAVMKDVKLLWRWHKRYDWDRRLIAYQNNQALILEGEQRRLARKDAEVWYERKKVIRERGFELGEKLLDRAQSLLQLPVFDKVIEDKVQVGDQVIETKTTLNFQQHPRDARLFLETAIKIMRLSADMPTDNVNLIPVDADLENMTDDEMLKLISELEASRKQLLEAEKD